MPKKESSFCYFIFTFPVNTYFDAAVTFLCPEKFWSCLFHVTVMNPLLSMMFKRSVGLSVFFSSTSSTYNFQRAVLKALVSRSLMTKKMQIAPPLQSLPFYLHISFELEVGRFGNELQEMWHVTERHMHFLSVPSFSVLCVE